MDDMEVRVNDRLKDLTVPELARVADERKKAQNDILKLQQEKQPPEFSIAEFEELEDDAPFIDLLGDQPKATDKCLRDDVSDEGKSHKKKKHKHNKYEKAKLREALKLSRAEEEMHIEQM
ncbi:hypothetical protein HAX54_019201 [Datura stramonium]|uniref:Uncharacterized protein n=1 Tax=Datura stramonium TaxID=4076 RepID=A0ABS8UNP8_DATST|nr:hypothetical protein [Datura stramonium]